MLDHSTFRTEHYFLFLLLSLATLQILAQHGQAALVTFLVGNLSKGEIARFDSHR